MGIYTITTPGLSIRTYILIDDATKKAAVIDPVRNVEDIVDLLKIIGAELLFIFETHVHADFVSGSLELKSRLQGRPLICASAMGDKTWLPRYADVQVHDRDTFDLGKLKIVAWHTPGHTSEHLMYILCSSENPYISAFTGDFLFAGSVGRPDLLGEEQMKNQLDQLYQTIFSKLDDLPDNLRILPAHGSGSLCGKGIAGSESTLGIERQRNAGLKKQPFNLWKEELLQGMPCAPDYFYRLKKVNLQGPTLLKDLLPYKILTSNELSRMDLSKYYILDVRDLEEFAAGHIQNSVNIPISDNFLRWAGQFANYELPYIILAKNADDAEKVIQSLRILGIDHIFGFSVADETLKSYPEIDTFQMTEAQTLQSELDQTEVIDVRTQSEWDRGHIPGAKHHEMSCLDKVFEKLPKNKRIAFVCGSGYRSSIAASLAQKAGIKNVCNIRGGMQAWAQQKLPIQK